MKKRTLPNSGQRAERRIRLAPEDRLLARRHEQSATTPPPPPEPRPFDLEALRAHAVADPHTYFRAVFCLPMVPPDVVTPQEARFWFVLNVNWDDNYKTRKKWIESLREEQFDQPIPLTELIRGLHDKPDLALRWEVLKLQHCWLPPADWIAAACRYRWVSAHGARGFEETLGVAEWYEAAVRHRLTESDREAIRSVVRDLLNDADRSVVFAALVLGIPFGVGAEQLRVIEEMQTTKEAPYDFGPPVTMALPAMTDPEVIVKHFRRLGLRLTNPRDARTWLAHTEYAALDVLRDSIFDLPNAAEKQTLLEVLFLVESPESARTLMEVKVGTKAAKLTAKIDKWFKAHREHAVAGLTPLAAESTPAGLAAADWLKENG